MTECRGILLDRGELERLIGRLSRRLCRARAGMPPGWPGMPGPKEAPLEVQSFRDALVTPFSSY